VGKETHLASQACCKDEHVCVVLWLIRLHAVLPQHQVGIVGMHIAQHCIMVLASPVSPPGAPPSARLSPTNMRTDSEEAPWQ
jgi:hypothetical protein